MLLSQLPNGALRLVEAQCIEVQEDLTAKI